MNCYVTNYKDGCILPKELDKDNTLFFPEQRMSTIDCFKTARPKNYHIVTDCPFLIPLYNTEEVFIWREGKWSNPDFNTFGTSYMYIISEIFYEHTIPQAIIDGKTTNCMGFNLKNDE